MLESKLLVASKIMAKADGGVNKNEEETSAKTEKVAEEILLIFMPLVMLNSFCEMGLLCLFANHFYKRWPCEYSMFLLRVKMELGLSPGFCGKRDS